MGHQQQTIILKFTSADWRLTFTVIILDSISIMVKEKDNINYFNIKSQRYKLYINNLDIIEIKIVVKSGRLEFTQSEEIIKIDIKEESLIKTQGSINDKMHPLIKTQGSINDKMHIHITMTCMVVIVDILANIVWVGYLFCAFKASFNFYQKPLVIHHLYYIKINLVHHFIFFKIRINIIHNYCSQIYHISATHLINNIVNIMLAYFLYTRVIYYIQAFNHQFNKTYVELFNIDNHVQLVIHINNLQFILTDNLFYLDQPLHHSISFEYVIIVWHCGEL